MTRPSRAIRCDCCDKPTRRSKSCGVLTDCGYQRVCQRCVHELYPAVEAEMKEKRWRDTNV